MDPTGRDGSVALPVPRAWLDPHVVDATRLDRLCADAELVQRLRDAGYTGRDWDYFVTELLKYGYVVLVSWMRSGVIWVRLRDRGIGGLPTPPEWEWQHDTWQDLAGDTLVIAIEKFRDTVLIPGRWDPQGRASLKTFFIGQCIFRFPNVYRSWHTAASSRQAERPTNTEEWLRGRAGAEDPERDLVQHDEITRGLTELDDRTRTVLLLLDQDYTQTEVAAQLGVSRKAVEMIVRHHRNREGKRHGRAS